MKAGRHKKGPKHQFGLQKGWQSPRSRSSSGAASPDNGSYEHLFAAPPDSSGTGGGELDAKAQTQGTDNESRSPDMSLIHHEHVSDHGHDDALEEEAAIGDDSFSAAAHTAAAGSGSNSSGYPGEWERHYDETEESYFFYCPDTDQSVWEEDMYVRRLKERVAACMHACMVIFCYACSIFFPPQFVWKG